MKKAIVILGVLVLFSCAVYSQPAQGRPFSIQGRVIDEDGKPVAGATVMASLRVFTSSDGRFPQTVTNEDGTFSIGVPRTGEYSMTIRKAEVGRPSTYQRFYYPDNETRLEVTVEDSQRAPNVTLEFPTKFRTITGRILEIRTGKPVTDAQIKLCRLQDPKYCYTVLNRDPNGKFLIQGVNVPFTVRVSATDLDDWQEIMPQYVTAETSELEVALAFSGPEQRSKSERLPAPRIVFPLDGADLFGFPRLTRLQWEPVPGAKSYTLDIEACVGGQKVRTCIDSIPLQHPTYAPTSGIEGTNYEFVFVGSQPGRWRVWAVDEKGRPGFATQWSTFFYPR